MTEDPGGRGEELGWRYQGPRVSPGLPRSAPLSWPVSCPHCCPGGGRGAGQPPSGLGLLIPLPAQPPWRWNLTVPHSSVKKWGRGMPFLSLSVGVLEAEQAGPCPASDWGAPVPSDPVQTGSPHQPCHSAGGVSEVNAEGRGTPWALRASGGGVRGSRPCRRNRLTRGDSSQGSDVHAQPLDSVLCPQRLSRAGPVPGWRGGGQLCSRLPAPGKGRADLYPPKCLGRLSPAGNSVMTGFRPPSPIFNSHQPCSPLRY